MVKIKLTDCIYGREFQLQNRKKNQPFIQMRIEAVWFSYLIETISIEINGQAKW